MNRCGAKHPIFPQIRCEEVEDHADEHFNSSYARTWAQRRVCCNSGLDEPHVTVCPEYEPIGDLPGMAGWWSGGFASNH